MTELEVLVEIQKALQTLIYTGGAAIGILLIVLFALAWGRNT